MDPRASSRSITAPYTHNDHRNARYDWLIFHRSHHVRTWRPTRPACGQSLGWFAAARRKASLVATATATSTRGDVAAEAARVGDVMPFAPSMKISGSRTTTRKHPAATMNPAMRRGRAHGVYSRVSAFVSK
jgi:hypothetical protein